MARLTERDVERWAAKDKRQEIPDDGCPGLYFIVQPTGKKSFTVRYRASGKQRRLTIGYYPAWNLKDARARAHELLGDVFEGEDPALQREQRREAHERDKVAALVEVYGRQHLSKLKTGHTAARELERHMLPLLGDRSIHDVTRRYVIEVRNAVAEKGRTVSANRVRAYMSAFFNWCVENAILEHSLATGVKAVAKEVSRDRVLSDHEILLFWRACDELGYPWGDLGKMLLLTGQRLGEVTGMTYDELHGSEWHIAASRAKNGRAHVVPLSGAALDVLAGVPRTDSPLLFTTTGKTSLSGYHKGRNAIADAMGQGIEHWTFHDLRRTAATRLARLGTPVRVTEAVLNHVSGTGGGIVAVYQRHDYADEKRQALDRWANKVLELVVLG